MTQSLTLERLMEVITSRTAHFLKSETKIDVIRKEFELIDLQRIRLKYLTTLMTLTGSINVYIAFSFDENLIETIFKSYTAELDILPEERHEYIEETAGDMINIVVGNATADFHENENVIQLTPPMTIPEAKSIVRHKNAIFYSTTLFTKIGNMSILCLGNKDLLSE